MARRLNLPAVTEPEQAAILAALRYYQRTYTGGIEAINDIATNGGEHDALDASKIDELCERINTDSLPADSR